MNNFVYRLAYATCFVYLKTKNAIHKTACGLQHLHKKGLGVYIQFRHSRKLQLQAKLGADREKAIFWLAFRMKNKEAMI